MTADRCRTSPAIRITAALALLVAVMTSPLRPAPQHPAAFHNSCLRRNYAATPRLALRGSNAAPGIRASQVKALSTEGNEKEVGRPDGRGSFLSDIQPYLARTTVVFRVDVRSPASTTRPLRC